MPTYLGKLTWICFFTTLGLACAYNVTEQMEFDQFKSGYLACLAPEHRNIVVDLASNGFITISPMANATIDFEDVTSDYFNCTDVNTNVQVTIASFYNEYGFGPDDNGYYHATEGPSEFERHGMDVRLYRPYYPGEFVMGKRSNALGVAYLKICTCIAQILHLLNSLIITFLDDDKTETGQSFVYIDGFLVKKHNNQHTIVNFETYKNKMKVSDRRKFEKANFDEFESALNNKNDLVHCPSITLFESIPTEVRSFYEDEKSGLIKVVKFRTGAMDRKRSFEKVVISVMVGKNVKKFLTFVEDEPDFQGGPIPSKYLIPKKINLMVYTLFQVHTLKFNRKDYDTLSLFYLNRGYYNELSFPCPGTLSRNSEC
ncbi:AQG_2a_G0016700.mRNA.1.CDS.1 [Saccharomyces cerevisiae]|nr:AQG_2a_G0016700.mRNA.1.CDS.1 [Saccharomyces cerevisiae]CAI7108252.1 AQG_2a_G0016700.mRNA.1.CDS.1 [Saccharomyces cerevisiae]